MAVAAALLAGLLGAVASAVALAIVDLYLAGHGRATLGRPWMDRAFVHVSRADAVLLGVSSVAAWLGGPLGWVAAGKTGRSGGFSGDA
jgi:hypothetical protein